MQATPTQLTYEIELQPGEKLCLPSTLVDSVGPGHWLVTVTPLAPAAAQTRIRDHTAFLNGYVAEDEGLYDDYPAR